MDRIEEALEERIRAGTVRRGDVVRRLAELAFGRANDCVRLALEEGVDMNGLDLSLLREVKRDGRGAVEVKLMDRLEILDKLAGLTEAEGGSMDALVKALQGGEDP